MLLKNIQWMRTQSYVTYLKIKNFIGIYGKNNKFKLNFWTIKLNKIDKKLRKKSQVFNNSLGTDAL